MEISFTSFSALPLSLSGAAKVLALSGEREEIAAGSRGAQQREKLLRENVLKAFKARESRGPSRRGMCELKYI